MSAILMLDVYAAIRIWNSDVKFVFGEAAPRPPLSNVLRINQYLHSPSNSSTLVYYHTTTLFYMQINIYILRGGAAPGAAGRRPAADDQGPASMCVQAIYRSIYI